MENKQKLYEQKFKKVEEIASGSYGTVYKVELKNNPGTYYALKKFKNASGGFNVSALREISILKELNHENIEKVIDIFYDITNLYVIFEYIDCVLTKLIKYNKLKKEDIKGVMYQILSGLSEVHNNGIIHRDLAPGNILINKNGLVKIADFGLSRYINSPNKPMSKGVVTMSYRAPEIFFLAEYYSFSIDIWSAGCIFAEMLLRQILFKGKGEIDILKEIFGLLGTPNDTNWPNAKQLQRYKLFTGGSAFTIKKKFGNFGDDVVDLLEKMLMLDPNKRISAKDALNHPYFSNDPKPSSSEDIAKIVTDFLSEYANKK